MRHTARTIAKMDTENTGASDRLYHTKANRMPNPP